MGWDQWEAIVSQRNWRSIVYVESRPVVSQFSLILVPLSLVIFGGALTMALSTPVWRRVKYILKFPFHPFETLDEDSSTEGTDPSTAKKAKRRLKRFKKVKKKMNYHEIDFWEVNQERKEDTYEIPMQNRQLQDQSSGKVGTWGSGNKSWSSQKRGKKPQTKTENENLAKYLP
jgi:hypothetical protein